MIKATSFSITGGKRTHILDGRTGDCIDAAKAVSAGLKTVGETIVYVFSTEGRVYCDDGRKADYLRRQAADVAKATKPAPVAPVAAPAKKQAKGKK
tara:strand:- start:474 stop:761 length:288 start_codon:yes stop_codon:yes gene_type:complete